MPYYKDIHLLFIHIPKTGGGSFENYLKKKYNQTLFYVKPISDFLPDDYKNVSPQHQTYLTLKKFKDLCNIDFDEKLKIISFTRNPYNRIISDLFWFKLIKKDDDPETIYNVIENKYLYKKHFDNHNLPQYKFICDENEEIIKRINLCSTENLTDDLHSYGFDDYEGFPAFSTYYEYLNMDSVNLINNIYDKDFKFFNYYKIINEKELNKLKSKNKIYKKYNDLLKKNNNIIKGNTKLITKQKKTIIGKEELIKQNKKIIEGNVELIKLKDKIIEENKVLIKRKDKIIEENKALIKLKDKIIEEKEVLIKRKDKTIEESKALITKQNKTIEESKALITKQKKQISTLTHEKNKIIINYKLVLETIKKKFNEGDINQIIKLLKSTINNLKKKI